MESDNLPEKREEESYDVVEQQQERNISYHSSHFYERGDIDEPPKIAGRHIKPSRACKVCKLVPELIDRGYSFLEATDAEQDLYRYIYTFWSAEDISRWLKKTHAYEVSHDSISRHINQHVPDPNLAMLERVRTYRPEFMNKRFFNNLADTMKLSVLRYQASLATGAVPLTTTEFVTVAKTLKEWQEFLSDMNRDDTDRFMQAVGAAIVRVLDPYPDLKDQFLAAFREELEKIEEEENNQDD